MTFRRSLAFSTLLAASSVAAWAQFAPSSATPDDNLNLRYANGIAAIVEDKVITIDDIRREISQYIPQIQNSSRSEREMAQKLQTMQDSILQDLIDRVLIIKEFHKDEKRRIPDSFVDNAVADRLSEQFDNDRSKFLAYLRARGLTMKEYRKEVEEYIINGYMRQQQRKSQSVVSPVRIETYYKENKDRFYQEDSVHLRMIQLSRSNGETDAELNTKASEIITRLRAGGKFEDLAREFSSDGRRSKGGDWGWLKRSDLKKEFSDPVFALKKGEFTDPILTPEGCFILFSEDRKYAGIQAIDDVRDEIERILVQQMSQVGLERWYERLRRNGYIKHF